MYILEGCGVNINVLGTVGDVCCKGIESKGMFVQMYSPGPFSESNVGSGIRAVGTYGLLYINAEFGHPSDLSKKCDIGYDRRVVRRDRPDLVTGSSD